MRIVRYPIVVIISVVAFFAIIGFVGCRIDHYALVRVAVRDIDTGELVTNETCEVGCGFECYNFWRALGWQSQRYEYQTKIINPEDGGVKWFWNHGDTNKAQVRIIYPPKGYVKDYSNLNEGALRFSYLMTFIPLPIHMPPFKNVNVYVRRQENPIDAEIRWFSEHCGPYSNGVYLVSYRPEGHCKHTPILTEDYDFTIGYDCINGEYCPPLGKGEQADILFDYSYKYNGCSTNKWGFVECDYIKKRTIRFPGNGNGFVIRDRSKINKNYVYSKDDFTAPIDGYRQEIVTVFAGKGTNEKVPWYTYVDIRIRSQFDEEGNLTSCFYGRFDVDYLHAQHLRALYYVNPTPGDRNLNIINGKKSKCGISWYL